MSTHYTLRGGHSGLDVDCGEFFVGTTTAASVATWASGAVLYIHIILFVVVVLTMV